MLAVCFEMKMYGNICVEPSKLLNLALMGEVRNPLRQHLDYRDKRQIGRLMVKTLARLIADNCPILLEVDADDQKMIIFCKYGPPDYDADFLAALAKLELAKFLEIVDAVFEAIKALEPSGLVPSTMGGMDIRKISVSG